MGMFKYNLYEPLDLSGSFELAGTGKVVGGKLKTNPNQLLTFDLQLFNEQHDLMGSSIGENKYGQVPYIHAILEKHTYCTIQNPVLIFSGVSSGGMSAQGLSKHIVFNQYFNNSAAFDGVAVLYNLWPEFCHPQGFKQSAKYNADSIEVDTTESQKLVFNDRANFSIIAEESFFDAIHITPKSDALVSDIKLAFEKAKHETGIERFGIGLKSEHQWFVRFEQKIEIENLENAEQSILHFAHLLFVLTYYPSTPVACDLFAPEKTSKGTEYEAEYPWVFAAPLDKKLLKKADQFRHFWAPITFPKIQDSWEIVVLNWFSLKDDVLPYVGILRNNMEGGAVQFKFPRCADALKQIGRDHRDQQYQLAVEKYAFSNLQNYLFKIFEVSTCEAVGEHISKARAFLVHSNDEKRESWEKVKAIAHTVECLELIILSYLHKLIGVPDQLREDFQNHWLDKLKGMNFIKFK
jgi:hypothetical protein